MATRILLVQGHPDDARPHFCHALADAYRRGAEAAGHHVETLNLAGIEIPLLRSEQEWTEEAPPGDIARAQDMIMAADHLVFVFPLWLGTMPALVKAFLEQVFRPGFAFAPKAREGLGGGRLKGKSARILMTMGMPGFFFQWFFGAHGYRYFKRNILRFCGIGPVRASFIGMVASPRGTGRKNWLRKVERLGHRAA